MTTLWSNVDPRLPEFRTLRDETARLSYRTKQESWQYQFDPNNQSPGIGTPDTPTQPVNILDTDGGAETGREPAETVQPVRRGIGETAKLDVAASRG